MSATVALVRDHQIILSGLEVLRLMGERMEVRQDVDREDIHVVLGFMRDVAHRCVDNTEGLIGPILASNAGASRQVLETTLDNHRQVRTLFEQLTQAVESDAAGEFVSLSVSYTTLLADLICEERRILPPLLGSASGATSIENIQQFEANEREIREVSRRHGLILRRLETKYTSPHCI